MEYNIVTNYSINNFIKKNSKYYKINLGQALTLEDRSGERVANKNDQFAFVYNTFYNAGILKQGVVGDITFYTDHQIMEDVVALYIDREEFIHSFEQRQVEISGIDAYLGKILKISNDEYDKIKDQQNSDNIEQKKGQSDKLVNNPGSVRFEDIQEYMREKTKK